MQTDFRLADALFHYAFISKFKWVAFYHIHSQTGQDTSRYGGVCRPRVHQRLDVNKGPAVGVSDLGRNGQRTHSDLSIKSQRRQIKADLGNNHELLGGIRH